MSLDSFQFHGICSSGTSGAFSQLIFFSQFDNELFFNVKQNITTIGDHIFGFQTVIRLRIRYGIFGFSAWNIFLSSLVLIGSCCISVITSIS